MRGVTNRVRLCGIGSRPSRVLCTLQDRCWHCESVWIWEDRRQQRSQGPEACHRRRLAPITNDFLGASEPNWVFLVDATDHRAVGTQASTSVPTQDEHTAAVLFRQDRIGRHYAIVSRQQPTLLQA
jgi:hypothetical protein